MRRQTRRWGSRPLTCEQLESRQLLAVDVLISEFMASNSGTLDDADGDSPDWLELHNTTEAPIRLAGWSLSDTSSPEGRWSLPDVKLGADEYLVIFASGKNRIDEATDLHTDFRLSRGGEYLGLWRPDSTLAHDFAPEYPEQTRDISYGVRRDGDQLTVGFMQPATPGTANTPLSEGGVLDVVPVISVPGGIYDSTVHVELSVDAENVEIRYTTNGSVPTVENSQVYTDAISIDTITPLRARAFREGWVPGTTATASYLFLQDVLTQTKPDGYPDLQVADYNVDPDIALSAQYKDRLLAGLRDIGSISIVMERDDFVGATGFYSNPGGRGMEWERPISLEIIGEGGTVQTQIDAGVRVQGGASRSPGNGKHSMSLRFRNRYGNDTLDFPLFDGSPVHEFRTLSLRGGSNYSWLAGSVGEAMRAQYIRDQWVRDSLLAMGQPDAGRGEYFHVYINGQYWGVYNLTERADHDHYAAYHGGDGNEYDAYNGNRLVNGTSAALDHVHEVAASGDWDEIQRVLDIDQYIDFEIINRGNGDLDASRNYRVAGGGPNQAPFHMYSWDAEESLTSPQSGDSLPTDGIGVRPSLQQIPEFGVRRADRLQLHYFNGGALTAEMAAERFRHRAQQLDLAIIGESARWGDHRREPPYQRDVEWIAEQQKLLQNFFPFRAANQIAHYRNEGRFPSIDAPSFSQHGGLVPKNTMLTISASEGEIYYTTDGSDPWKVGGEITAGAQAFDTPIQLTGDTVVSARVLHEGEWSALTRASFVIRSGLPLRITEINAAPHAANLVSSMQEPAVDRTLFQFLEVANLGDEPIDLAGVELRDIQLGFVNEGVTFRFAEQTISPGEHRVIVSNVDAFIERYGNGVDLANGNDGADGPVGQFGGNLEVGGETLTLIDADGVTIHQFDYGRVLNTIPRAAGRGSSLEVVDPTQKYGDTGNWQSSSDYGGNPGMATSFEKDELVINEVFADGNNTSSWIEIHNVTERDVQLGGWYLGGSLLNLLKTRVSAGTNVPANGFLTLDQSDFDFDLQQTQGGGAWLIAANDNGVPTRFIDEVQYPAVLPGRSSGRPIGEAESFEQLSYPTRNRENSQPFVGDIVISEVQFAAADLDGENRLSANQFEFVELFNRSTADVDLRNWTLSGDITYRFRSNSVLPAGGTFLVVAIRPNRRDLIDPFRDAYSIDDTVAFKGSYTGTLSDVSGQVILNRPVITEINGQIIETFAVIDRVSYDTAPPWPHIDVASGLTLTRTEIADGRRPSSWESATPTPGSTQLPRQITGDSNGDGRFDSEDIVFAMIGGKYNRNVNATFAEGDWNNDGIFNMEDFVDALAAGHYTT